MLITSLSEMNPGFVLLCLSNRLQDKEYLTV